MFIHTRISYASKSLFLKYDKGKKYIQLHMATH